MVPPDASPAMAQWFALKAQHKDALLFFRMGDFFEMFFEDAEAAAAALDIALTARGEHGGRKIPMCGVPVATAELYLARLIRRGFRVAVAEQIETPSAKTGKGPLKRAVVRLVTPGTLTEEALLEAARPNLLLALVQLGDRIGAAIADISTGSFETAALVPDALPALLGQLDPAEIIADRAISLGDFTPRRTEVLAAPPPAIARQRLAAAFGAASLDAFGSFSDAEASAGAALLDYLELTGAGSLPRLSPPQARPADATLAMDAATRASLEILKSRDGDDRLTLFAAVNRTLSAAGARLLAAMLAAPLTDAAAIAARQAGWVWLTTLPDMHETMAAALRAAPDVARALGRLALGRGGPRDLAAIRAGLEAGVHLAQVLTARLHPGAPGLLRDAAGDLTLCPDLLALLQAGLAAQPPLRLDDGGVIAAGYDGDLDAQRRLRDETRQVIAAFQAELAARSGVASLKIRHHAQLGYIAEVPTAGVEILRAHGEFTLRQGMANGARFTHPELAALDQRINEAASRAAAIEREIFARLVQDALARADALARLAAALASLDVSLAAARLAQSGRYVCPQVDDSDAFTITAGRHPVVEAALPPGSKFVPNECDLSRDRRVLLLTGPNMAGKSTYLRQNALIAILAQAGLPVPAAAAHIGVIDRLFSRVGAADELARGRSTFMVEMTETAAILHQAGPRSLVIVDEIGRGTSTLDGLAIAWAVLEALHTQIRARTIFATHFHELALLQNSLPRLAPHMMRVREWRGEVVFLHEVAAGAAGRSFGVQVARLAGVPANVVARAARLLQMLEQDRAPLVADLPLFAQRAEGAGAPPPPDPAAQSAPNPADAAADAAPDAALAALAAALDATDPDLLTPREAQAALYRLKALRGGDAPG